MPPENHTAGTYDNHHDACVAAHAVAKYAGVWLRIYDEANHLLSEHNYTDIPHQPAG